VINRIIVIVIVFLIASCIEKQNHDIVGLETIFTKQKEIDLETDNYLSIRFMEVNEHGELLVTGRRDKVLLFTGSGKLIRDLGESAREGYPGLNWSPNRAIFMHDGSIFVQNNAPWGIYFDENGNFDRTAPSDFHVSNRFTANVDNDFYSMEITPAGPYIRKLKADGDEMRRFDDIPERFINLMQRYRVGNQFVADDPFLFFTMVAEPTLFRLNLENDEFKRFEKPPVYFNQVGEDLPSLRDAGRAGLASEIANFSENYTANYSLHRVTDNILLMQHLNKQDVVDGKVGFGIQLVRTDGHFPMEKDLQTDEFVIAAGRGAIYTMQYSNDAYAPPRLNVYRLRKAEW